MNPPSRTGIPLRMKGGKAYAPADAGAVGTPRPTCLRGNRGGFVPGVFLKTECRPLGRPSERPPPPRLPEVGSRADFRWS